MSAVAFSWPVVARGQDTTSAATLHDVVEPDRAPSVGAVFREVPVDLWRFVSLDTAVVLAVGGGAALVVHAWDDAMVQQIQTNTLLNSSFAPGSTYGVFPVMLAGSIATYVVGRTLDNRHLAVVGGDLIRGQIVSQLWVQGLKYTFQRERPDQTDSLSLPSGHAAGAFSAATVLSRHYGWKAAIPAYIGATYVAAARVHDNRHFLSDVTFGAAMGIAGARTVMLKAGRYGLQVAPSFAPDRIGFSLALVPLRP